MRSSTKSMNLQISRHKTYPPWKLGVLAPQKDDGWKTRPSLLKWSLFRGHANLRVCIYFLRRLEFSWVAYFLLKIMFGAVLEMCMFTSHYKSGKSTWDMIKTTTQECWSKLRWFQVLTRDCFCQTKSFKPMPHGQYAWATKKKPLTFHWILVVW